MTIVYVKEQEREIPLEEWNTREAAEERANLLVSHGFNAYVKEKDDE